MIRSFRQTRSAMPAVLLTLVTGLALSPTANATRFLDRLNNALKELPKPREPSDSSAAATQAASPTDGNAATGASLPAPPNSGTPQGTAAILKATPKISAGDFYLGMPRDKAIAKLKADGLLEDRTAKPYIGFKFNQLPNQSFIGSSSGSKSVPVSIHREGVDLTYTTEPAKPVVTGIRRVVIYDPAEAPNVANTLEALRKKYGPESGIYEGTNELYWLFDYQGHHLSNAQVAQMKKNYCAERTGEGGFSQPSDPAKAIAMGYAETNGGTTVYANQHLDPSCFAVIHVQAYLGIRKPDGNSVSVHNAADWVANSQNFVTEIRVMVRNVPLEYSASTVTRDIVLNGGTRQDQQKFDAAKKNRPSL